MKKLFKKIFLNQKTILEKKINQKILKLSKNDKTIKILIIRFSSFGDVVLSTIFLEALINKYKNYSIDVFLLTKDKYKSVFENNPNIKKIFVFDKNIINTYKNIKNEISPDFIFDLSVNLKSFFIAFLFKTQTFRISKNVFYRRFLVYFKFLIEYIKINNISIKEKYSNFFNEGNEKLYFNSKIFLKQEELLTAKNILNFDNNFDYIGINTGATWNTKKWILENYVELVKRLLADGKKVVLIGGKTDLEFNKKIKEEIDTNINFIDLTAKLSERELFSVISLLKMIFTTDSASLHIAQAFNVPVFAIFGPTVKEFGFWYKGAKDFLFEDTNLKCRPCALHGNNKCPKRHFNCMKNISVDIVYFKIKNFFMNIYI